MFYVKISFTSRRQVWPNFDSLSYRDSMVAQGIIWRLRSPYSQYKIRIRCLYLTINARWEYGSLHLSWCSSNFGIFLTDILLIKMLCHPCFVKNGIKKLTCWHVKPRVLSPHCRIDVSSSMKTGGITALDKSNCCRFKIDSITRDNVSLPVIVFCNIP